MAAIKLEKETKQKAKYEELAAIKLEKEVKQKAKDILVPKICYISAFLCDYEITNNVADYVRSSEINEWIEHGKYGINMKKFGMEIKQYTMKNKMENVLTSQKKIYGKTIRIWVGIKHIENIIED